MGFHSSSVPAAVAATAPPLRAWRSSVTRRHAPPWGLHCRRPWRSKRRGGNGDEHWGIHRSMYYIILYIYTYVYTYMWIYIDLSSCISQYIWIYMCRYCKSVQQTYRDFDCKTLKKNCSVPALFVLGWRGLRLPAEVFAMCYLEWFRLMSLCFGDLRDVKNETTNMGLSGTGAGSPKSTGRSLFPYFFENLTIVQTDPSISISRR